MPMTLDRRQALIAAATGICSIARGARAQVLPPSASAPPIPRRLLFADPARSVVRISPDGRRIAFLAPLEGVLNLWVAAIEDAANARALTRVTDRSLGPWLLWLHDNRRLLAVAPRAIVLVDRLSTSVKEVMKAPDVVLLPIGLSADDRRLFLYRGTQQSDIWIANLK